MKCLDCKKPARAKQRCDSHYRKYRYHNDEEFRKRKIIADRKSKHPLLSISKKYETI